MAKNKKYFINIEKMQEYFNQYRIYIFKYSVILELRNN